MSQREPDFDFLIIGAGVCGLYQLLRLVGLGARVRLLEASGGVGGTWYHNRYPGCRFDSESYTYSYSFSRELLDEWDWTELFSPQPETLRYFEFVANKFDLRKDISLNSRVISAKYDSESCLWTVETASHEIMTTRFLLTAIGLLSTPTLPKVDGIESFEGSAFHTYYWPENLDISGLRVAVVGTGATGVQVISSIAKDVSELVIFQRHPNWCSPLHNSKISKTEMETIRASYDSIFARCLASPSGFIHQPDPRKTMDVSEAERVEFWEELYASPGFGIWLGNFKDTLLDEAANAELSKFMAGKIRQRVANPALAEKLIPKDHGFGTKRVPLEFGYYEVYSQPNVTLVDLSEEEIERVTPTGIKTIDREFEFDVIVFATGFDAVTGAFDQIEFVGENGQRLKDKWSEGPSTFMGIQTTGFPNLFTLVGPQSGSAATNFPRGIEDIVNWMSELAEFLRENDIVQVETTIEAEREWVAHVAKFSENVLFAKSKSWFNGYNENVREYTGPRLMIYPGGAVRYRNRLADQAEGGYPAFVMRTSKDMASVEASHTIV